MKKTMIVMILALIICLSACTNASQGKDNSNATLPTTEQSTPTTTVPENNDVEESDFARQEPSADEATQEEPMEIAPQGSNETPDIDADSPDNSDTAGQEVTQDPTPTTETEAPSTTDELSQDDILVEFENELVEVSDPFRMYSMMWTRTEDSYYAIAPDATFTVTNNGKNESAYLTISVAEYIRSAESFISVVNHDGVYKELDMLGEYWSDEETLWLSNQVSTELTAGENLCWAKWEKGGERPQCVKLLPGESVTFHLPMREQDTICFLYVRYKNDAEELGLPSRGFCVSADDVRAPSTSVTP